MIKLSRRLLEIADSAVSEGNVSVLADIGSDHGLIPAYLLKEGKAQFAIITDVSANSLKKAEKLIAKENLSDRALFVCADGIAKFPLQIDVVIIAGMGGMEIEEILKGAMAEAKRYVLSPMKNAEKLREYLVGSGYKIETDKKTEDGGKFYDIITAVRGKDSLSQEELLLGRTNISEKHEDFIKFVRKEREKTIKLLSNLDTAGKRGVYLKEYLAYLNKYTGV